MFLVGLTGGIASGKSTVSSILSNEFGIPVIDADKIARDVVKPNTTGWKRVRKLFGDAVFNADGTLNRDKLGEIVFNDATKRRQLNKSLHGLIALEMLRQIVLELLRGSRFVVLDAPLLFDAKMLLSFVSYKVVVYCEDESERIRRLVARNPNLSENDAKLRIQAQMNVRQQMGLADFLIDNSKELDVTRKQVKNLVNTFRRSKKYIVIRIGLAIIASLLLTGAFYIGKVILR